MRLLIRERLTADPRLKDLTFINVADLENLDRVELQNDDTPGPVSLAVAVEADADEEPTPTEQDDGRDLRLLVIGDSDFASNSQMQNVPNATLLANALNWLVDRETLVGIPPKTPEQVRLNLTRAELSRMTWLVLGGLPGLALLFGLAVYLKRRR